MTSSGVIERTAGEESMEPRVREVKPALEHA